MLSGKSVLVTGGTGSFGSAFIGRALALGARRVACYSRDEVKQAQMRARFDHDPQLRLFIGDVRDKERLRLAMRGVEIVVHAAALKQVPACDENPTEAVATNVIGAENVGRVALEAGVERVVFLGTDKNAAPTTHYGATKLCAEYLAVGFNWPSGGRTRFAATRYGNVASSRGSVIPIFRELAKAGLPLPITHPEMTRFWMALPEAVDLVLLALQRMRGGEVFIPKLKSFRVVDLALAIANEYGARYQPQIIGVRAGEKLHESLICADEARQARDYGDHYRILPGRPAFEQDESGRILPDGWDYRSNQIERLMSEAELAERLREVK